MAACDSGGRRNTSAGGRPTIVVDEFGGVVAPTGHVWIVRPSRSTVTMSARRNDLVQAMGHVDDRDAAGAQSVQDFKQPRRFRFGQAGGGLVEDQDARS